MSSKSQLKKKDDSVGRHSTMPTNRSKGNVSNKHDADEELAKRMSAKIDETDEMKLKMLGAVEKTDPDDLLYPPELNAHLIEQLQVMTGENNELRKLIFTKDTQISELKKTVTDLNTRIRDIISGSGPTISSKSAGIISAKITELCKQNRHLVAEVEGYKTKSAALERKVMKLEAITKENEKYDVCLCKDDPAENVNPDDIKELNKKLAYVNRRLTESKTRNLELKNEIIAATKILQQELGDKFTSLKELTNDVMGWKGRAEKIVLLQARINELEEQLKLKEPVDPKRPDQNMIIKDIEAKRKKEMEQITKDNKVLKDENQELKKKMEAARCRVRNLECDATLIRQKMQTYMEKSNADDMLINEQRNQIKTLELYYQEVLRENTTKMNKMHAEIAEYQKLNRNTESKIDALRKQASEKAAKIEELREQLHRFEECSLQSIFFTPMRRATDNEIQKLTELVNKLNERLDSERHKWEELEANHRKMKERKKRVERRVTQLEDELRQYKDLSRKGSRFSKTSITKDSNHFEIGASNQQMLKKKSSMIGGIEKSDSSTLTPESQEELDRDELKYRLELTEEKLKSFEDKLKMIENEKSDDLNNLMEMIATSKQLFNDALMALQKEKCICTDQ